MDSISLDFNRVSFYQTAVAQKVPLSMRALADRAAVWVLSELEFEGARYVLSKEYAREQAFTLTVESARLKLSYTISSPRSLPYLVKFEGKVFLFADTLIEIKFADRSIKCYPWRESLTREEIRFPAIYTEAGSTQVVGILNSNAICRFGFADYPDGKELDPNGRGRQLDILFESQLEINNQNVKFLHVNSDDHVYVGYENIFGLHLGHFSPDLIFLKRIWLPKDAAVLVDADGRMWVRSAGVFYSPSSEPIRFPLN